MAGRPTEVSQHSSWHCSSRKSCPTGDSHCLLAAARGSEAIVREPWVVAGEGRQPSLPLRGQRLAGRQHPRGHARAAERGGSGSGNRSGAAASAVTQPKECPGTREAGAPGEGDATGSARSRLRRGQRPEGMARLLGERRPVPRSSSPLPKPFRG